MSKTVLISGASITGPAVAYWLNRHGFTTTIVELSHALRPGGHAVDLRGVAREVVERMGVMPEIRQNTVDERGFAYVDKQGKWMARMPADAFGGQGIVAEIEIMRGDLSRVLYEATTGQTEYLFGDRIAELTQGADGVKVVFASGATRMFDLVIGADGVYSGVRGLAFGPHSSYVNELGAYTAYFTVEDPGDLQNWLLMYNAPGGRVATIRPERGGTAKASLSFTYDLAKKHDVRGDVERQQHLLRKAFQGVGWKVPQLLAAMQGAPDFYFDTISQVTVDRWSRGRVAVVGDAAYCGSPLTGMGTSTSLVGAYVLAGELASTPDDHEGAFARYQAEIAAYVDDCKELPPGGVKGFAPTVEVHDLDAQRLDADDDPLADAQHDGQALQQGGQDRAEELLADLADRTLTALPAARGEPLPGSSSR